MEAPSLVLLSLLLLVTTTTTTTTSSAQLTRGFYNKICPNVEQLVRSAVTQKFQQTFVTAPATLRLLFHDCFVRGCDASVLLASPNSKAEKDHPDDVSLAGDGFDTVVKAKAAVDRDPRCRNRVSCADILALATRDVVNLEKERGGGGDGWGWGWGKEMDLDELAMAFVDHYYTTFDTNRAGLSNLYQECSMLSFEGQKIQGSQDIVAKLTSLPFQQCHHSITSIDCQPAGGVNAAMLVFVTGDLQLAGERQTLKFSQMFHLIPTVPQGSYYVLNDIFRLIYA